MSPASPATSPASESASARRIVHGILRGGLMVSIGLMALGLALKLGSGDHHERSVELMHLGRSGSAGDTVMGLGVLVLGLTPALRVVVLAGVWVHQRDWRFVWVATVVVTTLVIATLLGGG